MWPFSKKQKESAKESAKESKSEKVKTLADYLSKHDSRTGTFNHNKDDLNILFRNFEKHLRKDVKYGSNGVPSLDDLKKKWAKGKFEYADLSKAKLTKVHLIGLDFSYANFEKARLTNCHFEGSIFISAYFTGTVVRHCNFKKTKFYKADFSAARFTRCDFTGSKITFCKFTGCYIINSKLLDGILSNVTIKDSKFQQNDIKNSEWYAVYFYKTALSKNTFNKLNTRSLYIDDKCTFKGSDIKQSLFYNSSIYATIEKTHIVKSTFSMHASVNRLASSIIKETMFTDSSIKSSFNNKYEDTVFARSELGRDGLMKDTFSKCTLYNVLLQKGPKILSTTFNDCKITRGGTGAVSNFNKGVFDKVKYVNCVIDNESYCGYRLSSVEYKNCVLIGVSFSESNLKDSIFDKSTAVYWSYFWKSKLNNVTFNNTSDTAYVKIYGFKDMWYNGKLGRNDSIMGPILDSYKLRFDHETYYLLDVPSAKKHYNKFDGKWSQMQGSDDEKLEEYIKQQLGSKPSKLKAVQAYHKSVRMVESGKGMFHSMNQWYNACHEHPEDKIVTACMKPFEKYCDSRGQIRGLHYVSDSNPSGLSVLGNPPLGF